MFLNDEKKIVFIEIDPSLACTVNLGLRMFFKDSIWKKKIEMP